MVLRKDQADTISRLRALRDKGISLRQASAELGVSKSELQRLAQRGQLPPAHTPRAPLPAAKRRQLTRSIVHGRASLNRIAGQSHISRSTVRDHRRRHLLALLPGDRDSRPALLAKLRALTQRGKTLQQTSDELGLPLPLVHKIVTRGNFARRRRAMPPSKQHQLRQLIVAAELSDAQISRRLKISKATVCKRRQQISEGREKYRPRKLRTPVRCPGCGHKVLDRQCRICQARGAA